MAYFDRKILYAGSSSLLTSLGFYVLAYVLDWAMKPSLSTLISLVIMTATNLFFQYGILHPKGKSFDYALFYRYPVGIGLDLFITYYGCKFFFDRREKYIKYLPEAWKSNYNTIVRMFVSTPLYFVLSYPIRRYWIFA